MKKNSTYSITNKALIICAAFLFTLTSCSSSKKTQKMSHINETKIQETGINDIEKNKIFVTMNATFKDEEKCRVAMEKIVNDAHAAYGVNSHFWFRSKDGKSLFVLEQYQDKKALRKAIMRFTSARTSFFKSIKVIDISVYGSISNSSKLMFAIMKPKYMNYFGGYSKNVAKTKEAGIKNLERKRILVGINAHFKNEEKCKEAMKELVKDTYPKSGINSHFWCTSKDGKSLFILKQFENEKSLISHLVANSSLKVDFFETIEVIDTTVYGTLAEKTKEIFTNLNPTYMNYYGGYSK